MCAEHTEKPLPKIVEDFIGSIVKRAGRSKRVRREVYAELADHFTDALHEFKTDTERQQVAEHLISQFGDPQMLASLIKRSKKRCRPLWLRITRRTAAVVGIVAAYLVINFALNFLPQPMPEFSRNTTYLENPPLDKDGMVDYSGWLNEHNSKGVTPENNMLTAFIGIMGTRNLLLLPSQYAPKFLPEYLKILGAEDSPTEGIYISQEDFAKAHNISEDEKFYDIAGASSGPWKKSECPMAADYLRVNEKPLAKLTSAINRPMYYFPYLSPDGMYACLLPSMQKFREIAKAFICRSNLEIANGNLDSAWADVTTVRKLGLHLMARDNRYTTLIEQLVGIAINSLADRHVYMILSSDKLTLTQAETFLRQLTQLAYNNPNPNTCMIVERMMSLDFALRLSQGKLAYNVTDFIPGNTPNVQQKLLKTGYNATVMTKFINQYFNDLEYNGKCILEGYTPIIDNSSTDSFNVGKVILGLITPQPFQNRIMGKLFIQLIMGGSQKFFVILKRENTYYEMTKVGFALRIYQLEHGKYPEKLYDLPAKLLQKYNISLTDPFSGREYKYSRTAEGFKLYSYGMNYADDGGRDSGRGQPDIIIEVPYIKPKK